EIKSKLPHRHAVTQRNRPECERLTGSSRCRVLGVRERSVENWTFDDVARDRIGAIQHDEWLVKPSRGAHRVHHRSDVRPGPRADVLKIEHERVKYTENAVRGGHRLLSVQRIDRKSTLQVDSAGNILAVFGPAQPVLGREQLDQIHGSVARLLFSEQVDVGGAPLVDPRLVCKEPDSLPSDQMDAITEKNRDAGPDPGLGELGGGIDLLADDNAPAAEGKENCEQPIGSHHRWESGKLVVFRGNK